MNNWLIFLLNVFISPKDFFLSFFMAVRNQFTQRNCDDDNEDIMAIIIFAVVNYKESVMMMMMKILISSSSSSSQ